MSSNPSSVIRAMNLIASALERSEGYAPMAALILCADLKVARNDNAELIDDVLEELIRRGQEEPLP